VSARDEIVSMGLPRPGKALLWVMGVVLSVSIMFAVGINYGGLDERAFLLFTGNTKAILQGQVWRLFTAGLMHQPSGPGAVWHTLFALVGLLFLAPTLEERWGAKRMLLFLIGSSVMGFSAQLAAEALLPRSMAAVLGQPYWFGSMGALEAIAVAWALSNQGKTVRLMFVLPVSATGMLLFIIGLSVLMVLFGDKPHEGLVTPFGGMLAGYLFGAGSPTPVRRLWLTLRYKWLARRASKFQAKGGASHLRIIEGGETTESRRRPPTDKRFLN
jgi:membrane associated rhomboid family serine protease